jgi:tetratricopeptide (TPR) repeat protein
MPDAWAAAQNNLGNTLYTLGGRTNDIPTLEKAVASFDAALTVYTVESNPVRWATAQSNRASAQMALADAIYASTEDVQLRALQAGNQNAENLPEVVAAREKAVALLTQSVGGLQAALRVRTKSDNPLDWALIQHTLASVLSDRGKLSASPADVRAAVDAYRDVLTVHDKARMPVQWATSSANLASALRQYATLTKEGSPLTEAAALLQQAIEMTPRATSPLVWAEFNTKLGNVWADAVDYDGKVETSDKAVAAYRAAAEVNTPEQDLAAWERLQLYIVQIELKTAVPAQDLKRLKDARAAAALASDTLKAHGNPDSEMFAQWVPLLDQFIGALGGK